MSTRELRLSGGSLVPAGGEGPEGAERPETGGEGVVRSPVAHTAPGARVGVLTAFGGCDSHVRLSRIDARVKVIAFIMAAVGIFAAPAPFGLLLWAAALAWCLGAARVGPGEVLRGMRPVALVLAFALLANAVSCGGGAQGAAVGVSAQGTVRGLVAVVRIALLVGFSLVVALTTSGPQMGDAIVRLLSPLARAGVPVSSFGTALSLALRFIPLTGEELIRIRLAQSARGARFDDGSLAVRIRTWMSVLVPLVVGLLRRGDRLAEAMDARCFGAPSAGRMPAPRSLARSDRAVLLAATALLALSFAIAHVR